MDRQRWLFENMLLMPKYEVWVKRSISVARVAGTTAIEGEGIGAEAVSDLMRGGAAARSDADAVRANSNAIAAYEFIDYLSDQLDIPLSELVIRELNRQFMRGGPELLTPGVYRRGQNSVGDFMPPNQGDVPALMRDFAEWLSADDDAHPVVRAGIAHLHLVSVHPVLGWQRTNGTRPDDAPPPTVPIRLQEPAVRRVLVRGQAGCLHRRHRTSAGARILGNIRYDHLAGILR